MKTNIHYKVVTKRNDSYRYVRINQSVSIYKLTDKNFEHMDTKHFNTVSSAKRFMSEA